MKELAKVLADTSDEKVAEAFLRTILTPSELDEISKRLQILRMLDKGFAQREIAKELGVSIGTISRGSRELKYGNHKINKLLLA